MKTPKPLSEGEETLALHLKCHRIVFEREVAFCPNRKWRVDFIISHRKLAIEVEGGIWSGGRHSRGKGMESDMEKYNTLALMGYRLLRFSTGMIASGEAIDMVLKVLNS